MVQACFGISFYRSGSSKRSFGRLFLANRVQQPVVSCRDLIDDLSVHVVEREIGLKKICLRCCDGPTSPTKIEDQIIEVKCWLKETDCLPLPTAIDQGAVSPCRSESYGCDCREEAGLRYAQCFGVRLGILPGNSCVGILPFGEIYQFDQCIGLAGFQSIGRLRV